MAQQIPLVLSTLLLLCSLDLFLHVEANSLAMSNCSESCGDVTIPYPFGMSSEGCYLEKSFKIDCEKNTTPTITINNMTKLEVIDISVVEGLIEVKFPIARDCDSPNRYDMAISLEESPFAFSSDYNKFIALGCNNHALLTNGSTIGGCVSVCDDEKEINSVAAPENGTCSGINCCQTTISYDLQNFNITLYAMSSNGNRKNNCRSAFLVNQTWFDTYLVWKLSHGKHVPVVLEWEVDYDTYAPILDNRSMEFERGYSAYCDVSTSTVSNNSIVGCYCNNGFEGNAYVPNGCHDVDECTRFLNICSSYSPSAKCTNTNGFYRCDEGKKSRVKVVLLGVGVGLGVMLLAIFIGWLCKVLRKRRIEKLKKKYFKRNGGLLLQEQLSSGEVNVEKVKMFSSKELDKATDHYNVDRMLGQGGQGTVYKGMLRNGQIVAVKKSKVLDEGNIRQFINEVVILSQINHRNVVRLLGCCLETEIPLLVYEFIPNGNLFQLIHESNEEFTLTWDARLRIAKEIAGALSYLHSAASIPIYHRDVKSTNILLDDKYRAKVADFGTSKSVTIDQTHVTTLVQGTFGYLDPEYFRSSQFTDKSDVYSFGVVLIELLTGQKPISSMRSGEARGLVEYFVRTMEQNRLFDIVDTQVIGEAKNDEILSIAKLASRCLSWTGKERPTMKDVTMVLEDIHGKSQQGLNVAAQIDMDQNDIMDGYLDFGCNSVESTLEINSSMRSSKPLLS